MVRSKAIIFIFFTVAAAMLIKGRQASYAWEPYDRVLATVNSGAVIASDVELKFDALKKTKAIAPNRVNYEKSRILDQFIEDELVLQNAEESAIIVTDKKVMSRLSGMLESYLASRLKTGEKLDALVENYSKQLIAKVESDRKFTSPPKLDDRIKSFVEQVERSQNQSFVNFFDDVKGQILRQDFLSISLGVSPPSEDEIKRWFNANKYKLGEEMWIKHILIIPKGNTFAAEREANNILTDIRNRAFAGESFESLAAKYSQDPGSAGNGGDLGWIMPAELDPYFAGNVFSGYKYGGITPVFKSGFGYHIAKYYGRRPLTLDKVYPMISQKLYYEKISEQFQKWVAKKKQESEIKIYMENYVSG